MSGVIVLKNDFIIHKQMVEYYKGLVIEDEKEKHGKKLVDFLIEDGRIASIYTEQVETVTEDDHIKISIISHIGTEKDIIKLIEKRKAMK